MKIFNVSQAYQVYQKQKTKKMDKVGQTAETAFDIQISSRGKEFQFAMDKLKQVPDVRKDKVEGISEKIKDGTYKVDTLKLANAMRSYLISEQA